MRRFNLTGLGEAGGAGDVASGHGEIVIHVGQTLQSTKMESLKAFSNFGYSEHGNRFRCFYQILPWQHLVRLSPRLRSNQGGRRSVFV